MGVKTAVAAGAAGVAAGLVVRSVVRKHSDSDGDGRHPEGWKAVTILGSREAFVQGGYPEPLERIADALEIRLEPAPDDKGFEVHARLRDTADAATITDGADPSDDPDQAVRVALRDAKQVFETGEILRATPRPHGHRPATLLGAAVDKAEDEAKGGGVL
jgi:hypothetical protein